MNDITESLLYLGGTILVWGKLGSISLALGLLIYGCYKFNKFLTRIKLLRSHSACQ